MVMPGMPGMPGMMGIHCPHLSAGRYDVIFTYFSQDKDSSCVGVPFCVMNSAATSCDRAPLSSHVGSIGIHFGTALNGEFPVQLGLLFQTKPRMFIVFLSISSIYRSVSCPKDFRSRWNVVGFMAGVPDKTQKQALMVTDLKIRGVVG